MRISARVDLGLRLVVAIADLHRCTGAPVARSVLLRRVAISEASLLTILGDLRKREIVRSRRGVNGGWVLARSADQITVAQVVSALDGPMRPPSAGSAVHRDGVARVWTQVGDAVHGVLGGTTIADLMSAVTPAADHAGTVGWFDNAS
jgi:Rrf2 family protein